MPQNRVKRAYAVIRSGSNTQKTSVVRSRAGEFVFIDHIDLDFEEDDAFLQIYEYINENQPGKLISSAQFKANGPNLQKKAILRNNGGEQLGQAYFKGGLQLKQLHSSNKAIRKILESSQFFASPKNSSMLKNRQQSLPNIHSSRVKKISIVHQNKNIFMPRQKRFNSHHDRVNDRVSYLQERSFEFKDPHSKKFYKGASIGYGGKYDFSHKKKQEPGVGQYKLPSIWDRY